MKSLMPWVCLAASAGVQLAYAEHGLDAYRQGNYFQAATALKPSNDPIIDYYLARMNLYGYGELKNNTLAIRYFKQAAEKGLLSAQQMMGRYALLVEKNPEQALVWFKKAADANETQAQMYCAAAYLYGLGVKKNSELARKYYIAAARNNNAIAQYTLAEHFLESRQAANKKLGVIWLNKAVEQGNVKAITKLGELFLTGNGVTKDLDQAKQLLNKAVTKGYIPALYQMGELALQENKINDAKNWFTQAADKNYTPASIALAKIYLIQNTPDYEPNKGYLQLLKAAQNGSAQAQMEVAKLYETGVGVPKDEALAKEWKAKAAASAKKAEPNEDPAKLAAQWLSDDKSTSFANTEYQLGGILSAWKNPNALKQNNYNQPPQMVQVSRLELYKPKFEMAEPNSIEISELFDALAGELVSHQNQLNFPHYPLEFKLNPAESGKIDTQPAALPDSPSVSAPTAAGSNLKGQDVLTGFTTPASAAPVPQTALQRLYNQAILGEPNAQFTLAQLYQAGIGVPKDISQAVHFYRLAADQKDLRAEYNLGLLYLEGKDTTPNYNNAIGWLTRAAFKGDSYAQYTLGLINIYGYRDANGAEIIKPDHEQGLVLLYIAAGNYFGPAQFKLAELLVREKQDDVSSSAKEKRNQLIKRLYRGAVVEGITEAELPLAFYYAREGDKEKQAQAFAIAKKEAAKGNGKAALLLGLMYDRGISIAKNPVEAMFWYQQSTENSVSAFILGTYLIEGKNITKDAAKGRALLEKAANAGFSYANLNLAVLKHQNNETFLPELDTALALGNSKAGLLLADYYLSLGNEEQKMQQAREIYQLFAEKGDKDGQLKLGYMFEQGLGGPIDLINAQHWYTLSAEQGQSVAQYLLGHMYQLGWIGNEPDYANAVGWYEKAKEKFAPAAVALGFIYDTTNDRYNQAQAAYEIAVKQKNPVGAFNLGLIYEKGKGQEVDFVKAKEQYHQAAESGHIQAMVQLAGLFFNGLGVPRDEQQALYWYKKAASLGDRDALYQLGLLSETGVGIKLDLPEAVTYYEKAAEKGNAKAILALARMYQYGLGVTKNMDKAMELYKVLADLNNPYAQYQLGTFYFDGISGKRLPEEGKRLLQQAEENGSLQAKVILQRMNAQSQERMSFIEPVSLNLRAVKLAQEPDLMYLEALSEWNRGNEELSRLILNKILTEYPHYTPAKRAYEQLHLVISQNV